MQSIQQYNYAANTLLRKYALRMELRLNLTVVLAAGPAKNTWLTLTMQLTLWAASSWQSERSQLPLVLVQRSGCFQLF